MSLPIELVEYWYKNAKQLGQLKSQKTTQGYLISTTRIILINL